MMIFVLLLAVAQAAYAQDCEGVLVRGKCFFVREMTEGGATVEEAELYCAGSGGELAVIDSEEAYDLVFFYLLGKVPTQMVLTGLRFEHKVNTRRPLLRDGSSVSYKPHWFENHPLSKVAHGEVVLVTNRNDKYSGYMNTEDGCRYSLLLCST